MRQNLVVGFVLLGWLLINVFQAYFTELFNDEAYYWTWSQYLDWGYFDHPPMIALLIKAGYLILSNELGVRLVPILMSTATFLLIWNSIHKYAVNFNLFILIFSSIALVHAGGFMASPDSPLIFFTACFFSLYKNWLNKPSVHTSVLLGITAAMMIYSKYHGLLILFFTFCSNWKMIKNNKFWIAVIVAVLFMIPHIYWQITNDFPTFKYHILQRAKGAYNFQHTLNFAAGQLLLTGPILGLIWLCTSFLFKPTDKFQRALKFCFVGIMLFFLLSSYKGRVEPHWTAVAFLPMMMLSSLYFTNKTKWYKPIKVAWVISFMLLVFVRLYIALPFDFGLASETHGWKKWAAAIKDTAGDSRVVFMNSFQKAAKYWFYSGEESHSFNNVFYRRNQFDLWDIEQGLQGQNVMYVQIYNKNVLKSDGIFTPIGTEYYSPVPNFRSYNKLLCEVNVSTLELNAGEIQELVVKIKNPTKSTYYFNQDGLPVYLCYTIEKLGVTDSYHVGNQLDKTAINPNESLQQSIPITAPMEPGNYLVHISLKSGWMLPGINGQYFSLTVN